jgi:hypothetical protein
LASDAASLNILKRVSCNIITGTALTSILAIRKLRTTLQMNESNVTAGSAMQ